MNTTGEESSKETLPHTAATGRATAVSFDEEAVAAKEKKQQEQQEKPGEGKKQAL